MVYQSAEIELIEDLGFGGDCWNLGSTWAITTLQFVKPKFHIGSQGWCVEMA
jgi:hypothetical protein